MRTLKLPSPHISDTRQNRAFSDIILFFAVMIVLTIAAKGTSNVTMPTVSTTTPYQGTINHSFQVQGSISNDSGEPFLLPEGLLVQHLAVREGETIQAGAEIATFSSEIVDQLIAEQTAKLSQMQLQATQLATGESADATLVQQTQAALDEAYNNYNKISTDSQQDISTAQSKYDQAQQNVNEILAQQPPEPSGAATENQESVEAAYKEWQMKLEAAQAELTQAESDLAAAKLSAENKLRVALASAQTAEDNRNSALHNYEKEQQSLEKTNASNAESAKVVQVEISEVKRTIELLQKIRKNEYRYLAPKDGIITGLSLSVGTYTTSVGGLLADIDNSYSLVASLAPEQSELIAMGATVQVSQGQITQQSSVSAMSLSEDGLSSAVTIKLQGEGWQLGTAALSFSIQGKESGLCLPATSVHTDNQGDFVYLVEEKNTVLGIQNVLVRLPITIKERGDSVVCVSGALNPENRIVSASTKPLLNGSKVRIDE